MPAGRLEKLKSPRADAAHPPLRAELLHLHSSSAQGRSVPPERAFGDMGRSDGSFPYKDCQMRLKGGREAGHAHHSQSASEQQDKTKCSTDCSGSSDSRSALHGSGPTLNWEHSTSPGHTGRGRGDLSHPQLTFWYVNLTTTISQALEAPDAGILLHAQL